MSALGNNHTQLDVREIWRPPNLSELTPRKISIKGIPGINVLRAF